MTAPNLRPLSIGEVVDASVKVYTRNALTMFKLVAIVVIPVQLLSLVVNLSTAPDPDAFVDTQPDIGDFAPFAAGLLVGGILSFIATTLATGACFKAVSDAYLGGRPDWRESLAYARSRLESLLWVSFIAALLGGLAFLLFIIPGIYLTVAWTVAVPVLLFEGTRGLKALGRSRALVRGRWWPVLGALVLGYILFFIITAILTAILGGLLSVGAGDSLTANLVVQTLVGIIGAVVTTPFQAALIAIIYFDLRVRKEGLDVALLTERMASPTASGSESGWSGEFPGGGPESRPPDRPAGG